MTAEESDAKWIADSEDKNVYKRTEGNILKVAVQGHTILMAESGKESSVVENRHREEDDKKKKPMTIDKLTKDMPEAKGYHRDSRKKSGRRDDSRSRSETSSRRDRRRRRRSRRRSSRRRSSRSRSRSRHKKRAAVAHAKGIAAAAVVTDLIVSGEACGPVTFSGMLVRSSHVLWRLNLDPRRGDSSFRRLLHQVGLRLALQLRRVIPRFDVMRALHLHRGHPDKYPQNLRRIWRMTQSLWLAPTSRRRKASLTITVEAGS